jgi:cystathionine gamma-lyase
LGELEGGLALAFASGMAAFSAVLGTLRPGETAVFPSDSYYLGRVLSTGYFGEMGIKVRMAPTAGNAQAEVLEGAKLLWLETPSNPGLEVCDVQSLCNLAHQKGLLVALDNTTPTLLGQKPLELGADFSVASDTKALSGHSDLLMGHVAVKDPQLLARLHTWRTQIGAVPGPMEVWLAHRSLATLDVRLERMNHNALMVAEFLSQHPKVEAVRYPGLASDPSYPIAAAQMRSFGPVLSLTLSSRRAAEQFLSACELVLEATSFGGVHTSAERRGRWGGDAVPEGFIRMSVGLEKAEDLLEDMTQALQQVDGG